MITNTTPPNAKPKPKLKLKPSSMKAIVIEQFGGPECLVIKDIPEPEPQVGHVVIRVKAIGINRAETYMRRGMWAQSMPVSGVECVGLVEACPGGEFQPGDKVVTLMGGLGRTVNGSYAEYTNALVSNVVKVDTKLPWERLAAIPEAYATTWTCLFRNLELKKGQTILIRGATSSLGQAAVNLAVGAGARVIATTRNQSRVAQLKEVGVMRVEIERSDLADHLMEKGILDAVLNLIGNSVLLDSMHMIRRGGRMCLAGFLGGLDPVKDFNPLLQMPSGIQFSFFGSFVFGGAEAPSVDPEAPEVVKTWIPSGQFPLTDVPLQGIIQDVEAGKYQAKPSRVFPFEEMAEAHRVVESNQASGKLVVLGVGGGEGVY